nr:DNA-directed RNA polymerase V subunit 7-like [Tanacetum cinerariifolium]
ADLSSLCDSVSIEFTNEKATGNGVLREWFMLVYQDNQVSLNEPTASKKKNTGKQADLEKAILVRLLDDFSEKKVTKALGYLLTVTTRDKIDEGKVREHSGDVLFPLSLTCLSFKVFRGEVIEGVVQKNLKHGVFLRCGQIENLVDPKL